MKNKKRNYISFLSKRFIIICILCFLFFQSKKTTAQIFTDIFPEISISTNLYISPFFTLGYTINSGFNYGVDITFGLFKIQNRIPYTNTGVSMQYYITNYENSQHHIIVFNVIAENEYFRIGAGAGEIKKTWGFRKRNKSKAFGTSIDFGISTSSYKTPWLGFKSFVPQKKWEWSVNPYYVSLYSYFKFEPFYINSN